MAKELCAELHGFTLHAAVRIRAGEDERLEHQCRYVTRPPLSTRRLSLLDDGRVVHELRTPFRDGTTHLVFEPVLAPAASWRDAIVPRRARDRRGSGGGWCSRYSWPELMRRVFAVDALKCAQCGSRRRWIAAITERDVIMRILEHLGLPSEVPLPAPARAPPQGELDF